jgi:CheY-like chemotaxis protein
MEPYRLLLVDPVDDDRDLQATVLRAAGFVVIVGPNPMKAAIEEQPDVIVVDVTPKRLGAADFIRSLKEDDRTSRVPVVIVSTYPSTDVPPSEGFVCKPSSPSVLLDEIARVLKGKEAAG